VGTCLSTVTDGRIDLKFYSGTAREFGFAASGWSEGVLAGRAKEMKNGKVRLSQEQLSTLIGGIELGEIPSGLQAKLLQVLQEQQFERVGKTAREK
jgi:transcriptional regulator of aromatic amino acid metabolism